MSARQDKQFEQEQDEANFFAMHLLMPSKMLKEEIRKRGGIDLNNERLCREIAAKFQVSVALLGYRIAMLEKEP